jgi:hypothetical protein
MYVMTLLRRSSILWSGLFALTLNLSCAPTHATTPTPAVTNATAFVDVSVIAMDSERVQSHQTVVIGGTKIVAVGPANQVTVPTGAHVIRATGKFLLPGLVDMHAHLIRNVDLSLYLAEGVTTVRNMQGSPLHVHWREQIKKGSLSGPQIVTAGPIVDGTPPAHPGSLIAESPNHVEQVLALHRRFGYDFIKVYNRLPKDVYHSLVTKAKAENWVVAGHVPRSVGLMDAVLHHQDSIEHMSDFPQALQRDDSPARGKYNRKARAEQFDFIDESKFEPLLSSLKQQGTFVCPTLIVLRQFTTEANTWDYLHQPEMKYVPACDRATWEPDKHLPPKVLAGFTKYQALSKRLVHDLHARGVPLLLGTDPANPLVIPGFSVHEELALLVESGLTPFQALQTGTTNPAAFFHHSATSGTLAVGKQADLLLLNGNPLLDIKQTKNIAGVLAQGKWYGPQERSQLLKQAYAFAQGKTHPFSGFTSPFSQNQTHIINTFEIRWNKALFGMERWVVHPSTNSEPKWLEVQQNDLHDGQYRTLRVDDFEQPTSHATYFKSEGSKGQAEIQIQSQQNILKIKGNSLPGMPVAETSNLPEQAIVGAQGNLSNLIGLLPLLKKMAIGDHLKKAMVEVDLGSKLKLHQRTYTIKRLPDTTWTVSSQRSLPVHQYQIQSSKHARSTLYTNQHGEVVGWDVSEYGSIVEFRPPSLSASKAIAKNNPNVDSGIVYEGN